jgi:hypothetical protein
MKFAGNTDPAIFFEYMPDISTVDGQSVIWRRK